MKLEGCFHGGSADKASACNVGDQGSIPGLGRSPGGGNGNPLQYSILKNFHGLRSLVGYSPWGHKELDTTEQLHFHFLKLEGIWKQKHSHVKILLQLFLHGIREQSAVNSLICSCLKFLTNNQDSPWTAQSQNPINENACCSLWLFFKKLIFYHKKTFKGAHEKVLWQKDFKGVHRRIEDGKYVSETKYSFYEKYLEMECEKKENSIRTYFHFSYSFLLFCLILQVSTGSFILKQ